MDVPIRDGSAGFVLEAARLVDEGAYGEAGWMDG